MEDLKDLIINTLDSQGVLGEIRAQLRMLVFKSIDNEGKQLSYDKTPAMQLADTDQGRLCIELLRDFMAFFKLNLSLNVLLPETRLTEELPPEKLRELLGFRPEPGSPLLFQILDKLNEPDPVQPKPVAKAESKPWPEEAKKPDLPKEERKNPEPFKDKAAKPAEIPQIPPFREKPADPAPFKQPEPKQTKPADIIPPFSSKPKEQPKPEPAQVPSFKEKPKEQPKPAEPVQVPAFKEKPKEQPKPEPAQIPSFKEKAKPAEIPSIPQFKDKPKEQPKPEPAQIPAFKEKPKPAEPAQIPAFKDKPKPAEIPPIPAFKGEDKKGKLAPLKEPMGRRLAIDDDDTNEPEKERLRDIGRTLEQMQRADRAGKQVDLQALDLDGEVEEDLEGSLEHQDSEEDASFHSDMLNAFDHAEDAEPLRRR